eukprot:9157230-Alexandrium_andersonii.AAC.1
MRDAVDGFYYPSKSDKPRVCCKWLGYVNGVDVCAESVLRGALYADAECEMRTRSASSRVHMVRAQSTMEARESQEFVPES